MLKLFERHAGNKKTISDDGMMFTGAVVNRQWAIVAGERNEWDGSVQLQILKVGEQLFNAISRVTVTGLLFFHGLRHVGPKLSGWTELVKTVEALKKLIYAKVENHFENHDPRPLAWVTGYP